MTPSLGSLSLERCISAVEKVRRRLLRAALESARLEYRHVAGTDAFLDGPGAKLRAAVHIDFANEKVRSHEALANPDVSELEDAGAFRVVSLDALVRIKLVAFRDTDRTHLRDLIEVGLVNADWLTRLPAPLDERFRHLLDNPDG